MAEDMDKVLHARNRPWLALALLLVAALLMVRYYSGRTEGSAASDHGAKESGNTVSEPVRSAVPAARVTTPTPSVPAAGVAVPVSSPAAAVKPAAAPPVPEKAEAISEREAGLLLLRMKSLASSGDFAGAQKIGYRVIASPNVQAKVREQAQQQMGHVNVQLLLSPNLVGAEKKEYIVEKGDSGETIARKFGTTVDLIQRMNDLKDINRIRAGARLLVCGGKFAVTASISRHELIVTLDGRFFNRYRVGTGSAEKPTPKGTFVVSDKQKEPVWWRNNKPLPYGDPENILGTRWMALKASGATPDVQGYGIHGTTDNSSIGRSVTAGCLRMTNADVEELYMFLPVGTPVSLE